MATFPICDRRLEKNAAQGVVARAEFRMQTEEHDETERFRTSFRKPDCLGDYQACVYISSVSVVSLWHTAMQRS